MIAYHYTLPELVESIRNDGLRPGSEVNEGECLPFVLCSTERYTPVMGRAYLMVDVPAELPQRMVNAQWLEVYATIPASAIVAIAMPPSSAVELTRHIIAHGVDSVDDLFEYKEVA